MYLSAKLIGITSAVIATGTTASFVIPYVKSTRDSWFFQKDPTKNSKDFQELDRTAEEKLKKLNSWFQKFSSAKAASDELKKAEFSKMDPLFDSIFKVEEEIQRLFKSIAESLKALVEKNETLFNTSKQKLDASKKQKLEKELWDKYSTITDILKKWKTSLNQITCAIDKREKATESCVGKANILNDAVDSVTSFLSNIFKPQEGEEASGGGGSSGSAGGSSSGGAKQAEEGLQKVKEELEKALRDFNKQSVLYGAQTAYSLSKEKAANILLIALEGTIKSLNQQIDALTKSIQQEQETSNQKSEEVRTTQTQLENTYKKYSELQRMETLFQWWKEIFEEKITKNEDDKVRETDLSRRRRR